MNTLADYSQRPTRLIIDLTALQHNFFQIKSCVGTAKVMAVVKANAYGHGLIECARSLSALGVDYLGVALLEEGELLRKAGINTPILVFGGILESQIERFLISNLEITASSISKLDSIDRVAGQLGTKAKVHLKIDTGMGRIGVRPQSAAALISACRNHHNLLACGIFSHFACSDDEDINFTDKQLKLFQPIVNLAKKELGSELLAHISNSAAISRLPAANMDMVRVGLALFGVSCGSERNPDLRLKAVLRAESKVVFFKVVKAGDSVSYGRSWVATKDTRVVTVPIGYGDGYPRSLSNKASVIIRGKRHPVIGKVCMDQIMVAIEEGEAFNEDVVTLIGKDGDAEISVEELAQLAGTVPHEILTTLNLRMQRTFI